MILATLEEAAATAARDADDDDERRQCLELRNQLKLYRAGEYVEALLDDAFDATTVAELLRRIADLPPPFPLWGAVSVGYRLGREWCTHGAPCERFTRDDQGGESQTVFPLNQGMGYAFAAHVLEPVSSSSSAACVAAAISDFEKLCEANATAGYLTVALEVLGFAAAGNSRDVTDVIERCVTASSPELLPLYWHGVGRARYFDPDGIGPARPFVYEPNVVEGFAWQAALTNVDDPAVLDRYLGTCDSDEAMNAFAAGVQSALETWRQCVPADDAVTRFARHVPSSPKARARWRRVIGQCLGARV
jgi:hypothetical protein